MGFLVHIGVSALLLYFVGRLVDGIEVRDGKAALFGALALGVANGFIRPLLIKLTLPITIVTMGLFVFVVNACMFMLAAGFEVDDFWSALWATLALSVTNFLVAMLLGI